MKRVRHLGENVNCSPAFTLFFSILFRRVGLRIIWPTRHVDANCRLADQFPHDDGFPVDQLNRAVAKVAKGNTLHQGRPHVTSRLHGPRSRNSQIRAAVRSGIAPPSPPEMKKPPENRGFFQIQWPGQDLKTP
jgi:hypothetical protein